MDRIIEEKIINTFFKKSVRGRLLYELGSVEKRGRFFDKIAHRCEDYIDCGLIVQKSGKLIETDAVKQHLRGKNHYVIAYRSELDGKFAELENALNELYGNGPFLIYSIDSNSIYLETEYDFDIHPSYILSEKALDKNAHLW